MGQTKLRGSFEQRKSEAELKLKIEHEKEEL